MTVHVLVRMVYERDCDTVGVYVTPELAMDAAQRERVVLGAPRWNTVNWTGKGEGDGTLFRSAGQGFTWRIEPHEVVDRA